MGPTLGRCAVRELDNVHVDRLGESVFADVAVIKLHDNVVANNSVQIVDSNGRLVTCRFDPSSIL